MSDTTQISRADCDGGIAETILRFCRQAKRKAVDGERTELGIRD